MFKKLLGILSRKPEKKEKREEASVAVARAGGGKGGLSSAMTIGVISGKGGCGKSVISANAVILASALYRSIVAVDTDIINATLTSLLLSPIPYILSSTEHKISFLDYIVDGPQGYLYDLRYPRDRLFNIQIAGKPDMGVSVKKIYFLPAKRASPDYTTLLQALNTLTAREINDAIREIYDTMELFARKNGILHTIYDFPPLRAEQRRVFDGVFVLLEKIPKLIAVVPFDPSAVHGLVSLIAERYAYIKRRVIGFLVNMSVRGHPNTAYRIYRYIKTSYGDVPIHFIRYDRRWKHVEEPPIIYGDPSKGASGDLIRALTEMGVIEREQVIDILEFDPLEVKPIYETPESRR